MFLFFLVAHMLFHHVGLKHCNMLKVHNLSLLIFISKSLDWNEVIYRLKFYHRLLNHLNYKAMPVCKVTGSIDSILGIGNLK